MKKRMKNHVHKIKSLKVILETLMVALFVFNNLELVFLKGCSVSLSY